MAWYRGNRAMLAVWYLSHLLPKNDEGEERPVYVPVPTVALCHRNYQSQCCLRGGILIIFKSIISRGASNYRGGIILFQRLPVTLGVLSGVTGECQVVNHVHNM